MSAINVELGKVRSSKQKAGAQCNMEPTCLRPFSLESVVFPFCIQCFSFFPVNGKCFLQSHKNFTFAKIAHVEAFLPPRSCILFFDTS